MYVKYEWASTLHDYALSKEGILAGTLIFYSHVDKKERERERRERSQHSYRELDDQII